MSAPAIQVERHASLIGRWEMAFRDPLPPLRGIVKHYVGWSETTPGPLRRRELPISSIPVIISFGPSFELLDPHDEEGGTRRRRVSFVAGLHDEFSVVEHAGFSHGVEIYFTPLGARRFFRLPLGEVSRQIVELEDVLGARAAAELVERLATAPGWAERFALLDATIAGRLAEAVDPPASVAWAWKRLTETDGRLPIAGLAREIGCSRRHLVAQMREELGLPPKTLARVLRFNRAVALLGRDDGTRFSEIALDCGYYDQAHLNRDFRAFAGDAPTAFLARRLPGSGGWEG